MKESIKFEFNPQNEFDIECKTVEVEITNPTDEVNARLNEIDDKIADLDISIDRLTNHADKLDYIVAAASGILTGLLDVFFVGEFNLREGRDWSSEKINDLVKKIAKSQGYEGDDLTGAIRYLEKFGIPSDSVYNKLGGARQHHLRDFAHHASPIGLIFSLLTQFTEKAYGTTKTGMFTTVKIQNKEFIGNNIPNKIIFGLVYWIFHMASDMAGSSGSAGGGEGIPGPILSIVKFLSSLPMFNDKEQVNQLSLTVSKLFNGTLFAERDENGKIAIGDDGKPLIMKMDLRGELGIAHQIGKQALPVILNEAIVRGFYFVNRLIDELKEKKSIKNVNWKNTVPFNNRTIARMMTIATGTFTAVDMIGATVEGIKKGNGELVQTITHTVLHINFVGIGRFVIAIGNDSVMGLRKGNKSKDRMKLKAEALHLMEAKMYYGESVVWSAVKDANVSIDSLYDALNKISRKIANDTKAVHDSLDEIENIDVYDIEKKNAGLIDDLLDNL